MNYDPIRGKTIQWSFEGPMGGKTYEHVFAHDGTVTYRTVESEAKKTPTVAYRVASITPAICAISYLGDMGYTLTAILDFNTNQLVAFASNERELSQHRGSFAVIADESDIPMRPRPTVRESRAQQH